MLPPKPCEWDLWFSVPCMCEWAVRVVCGSDWGLDLFNVAEKRLEKIYKQAMKKNMAETDRWYYWKCRICVDINATNMGKQKQRGLWTPELLSSCFQPAPGVHVSSLDASRKTTNSFSAVWKLEPDGHSDPVSEVALCCSWEHSHVS